MTPEEWHKVKDVLQTALELEPRARASFLDSACVGQASFRTEVESLLQSHDEDGAFLEAPAVVDAANLDFITGQTKLVGRRLGPYELLEQIGEGGMGAVYRAARADGLYDKQVAIKLIRSGMSTGFFVGRFRNERQILAGLEHPNIARLLDGGVTEEGLPYVVLEFVAGMSIDEYCARHDLPIADRLKLFRTVCSAVQFAHQNLVVHRDLKPGNILVTEDGIPKLVDFGIAKILGPEEETGRDRTLTFMRIMTPDFASPEQVRGDPITTATDVYSLGVILYLLLTGRRPYRVSSAAPHEIVKAICDTEPEKPSTAVTRVENAKKPAKVDSLRQPSEQQGPDSKRYKLRHILSGDLDNIVLKALRKEPDRRYATVEQLSEDIRRHLEHLPVIARKDTLAYRASKFTLRHKVGVGITAAVSLLLLAALSIAVAEARIARAERMRAERRFNDVRALANSLIIDVHDSIKDLPGSTPARKLIVDRALKYLNALAEESGSDVGLQRELATAYERVGLVQGHPGQDSLGDIMGSLESYKKALDLRKQIDWKSTDWQDRLALARCYRLVADMQGATRTNVVRPNIDQAIAISEALDREHPNAFPIMHELASEYYVLHDVGYGSDPNEKVKATEALNKSVATYEAALEIQPDDLDTLHEYALRLRGIGLALENTKPRAALDYYQRVVEIEQKVTQRSDAVKYARGLALAYRDLGAVYENLRNTPRQLDSETKSIEILEGINRADPENASIRQSLAIEYTNMALVLARTGKIPLALEDWRKSLEMMRSLGMADPLHRHYLAAIVALGGTLSMREHKPEAALRQFGEARAIYQSLVDAGNATSFEAASVAQCSEKMAEATALMGNGHAAADAFHHALAIAEPLIATKPPDPNALYAAADAYSGLGDLSVRKAQNTRSSSTNERPTWEEARSWYVKSLQTWRRIEHPNRSAPYNSLDAGDPGLVAKRLQQCDTVLAAMR